MVPYAGNPPLTVILPSAFLNAIGRPVDPDAAHDTHEATVGATRLRLRRDCHGVLRRLEVQFGADAGAGLETAARWTEIVPGRLSVADVAGLGRLNLQPDRLEVTFRLHPDPTRLAWLLRLCTGAEPASPGP